MIKLLEILNLTSQLYVGDSNIHGKGLFTKTNIPKGSRIMLAADFNKYPNDHENVITPLGKFINHINSANTEVKISGKLGYLYSTQDIASGDELTADYKKLPNNIFNKDIDGFKNELSELGINDPVGFSEKWIAKYINEIIEISNSYEYVNPRGNIKVEKDNGQMCLDDYELKPNFKYYIVSSHDKDCVCIGITNDLDPHLYIGDGPISDGQKYQLRGVEFQIQQVGC